MLGSGVQNLIALTDSVLLYHLSETDFGAIGIVGMFYLVISAIGYGFSRGGQILIARRAGEKKYKEVSRAFYDMLYFELLMAVVLFLFMQYGCPILFKWFIHSPVIYQKCIDFLSYRSYGVFFSFVGLAMIAFYTGIAITRIILIDTIILALINFVLNYGLIFGHWGLPQMGIAGAGLGSTLAEVVAFVVFMVYMFFDKNARLYKILSPQFFHLSFLKSLLRLSLPAVAQGIVGIGSWFIFFTVIEQLGERPLAISNLVRIVYLTLSIPCWGFSAAISTIVSSFIGMQKRMAVIPMIKKTSLLSFCVTAAISLPTILFPKIILYPVLGKQDMSLVTEAQPVFWVLLIILIIFSIGSIVFNGLSGTGEMVSTLNIQTICAVIYLVATYLCVSYFQLGLNWAWGMEALYWIIITTYSWWFLYSKRWVGNKV